MSLEQKFGKLQTGFEALSGHLNIAWSCSLWLCCVALIVSLASTREAVLMRNDELRRLKTPDAAIDRLLGEAADPKRKHPLYNTSSYTFSSLLGDPEDIAPNLVSYINGFCPAARHIFERFKFADQIEKLRFQQQTL